MTPIDMILHCPECHTQHIDASNEEEMYIKAAELGVDREGAREYEEWLEENVWTNPPHKSHLCLKCKCVWRPSDVFTNGVEFIKTAGQADTVKFNGS